MNDSIGNPAHRIRLHGPWDLAISTDSGTTPLPRQFMPSVLPGGGESGSVTYLLERRFGKPTGLGGSRVHLVIEKPAEGLELAYNGQPQTLDRPETRLDITDRLELANRLAMKLTVGRAGWLPFAGCRLEITESGNAAS